MYLIFQDYLTSMNLFYQRFKIWINDKRCSIRFLVLINLLLCLEVITTFQKSLFSHAFLWASTFLDSKVMKTIQTIKVIIIPFNNSDILLLQDNAILFFGINKRVTYFSCFELWMRCRQDIGFHFKHSKY